MQENIDEALKKFVEKELYPAEIVDLKTEENEDADGDPVLWINVVYRTENNRLDPAKVGGLSRHLRARHGNLIADRYPLFSFMIPEEIKNATA